MKSDTTTYKPRSRAIIALLLLFSLIFSMFPASVFAATPWANGTGDAVQDPSGSATTGYYLNANLVQKAIGYRFTLVDANGNRVGAPKDLFEDSLVSSYIMTLNGTVSRFKFKYSKMELKSSYTTLSVNVEHISPADLYDSDNCADSDWGLSLPTAAADMASWLDTYENKKLILKNAWGYDYGVLEDNLWAIAAEPIYLLRAANFWMALTVTEIPIVAKQDGTAYSSSSPTWTSSVSGASDGGATWKFISNYTHASWPMSLRLSETRWGMAGGSDLEALYASESQGWNWGTAKEIITGGYGICLAGELPDPEADVYTIYYHPNGGTGSTVTQAVSYGSTMSIKYGSIFTAPAGKQFAGWTTNSSGAADSNGWAAGWSGTWVYTDGQFGVSGNELHLYAMWETDTTSQYTIYYHPNGGTGSVKTQTITAGQSITLYDYGDCGFSRTGYKPLGSSGSTSFNGREYWTTNSSGAYDANGWFGSWSGTWVYTNGQYGISGYELHLYAMWEEEGSEKFCCGLRKIKHRQMPHFVI